MTIGILNSAIEAARKSIMYPYKVGCVCFKGKRILSTGFNQKRTSKGIPNKYKKYVETLHAEHHAIMKVKDKELLTGASILIIRITHGGRLSMARPCENCMASIIHFNFKNIYYSNENGEIIMEKIS